MRGGGQVACSGGRGGLASWGGARAEDRGLTDPVDRAPAAGLPAAGLTAVLSSNAATLLGL